MNSEPRFQSSLGTDYLQDVDGGSDIDRLSLAKVQKVNYTYNTVDLVGVSSVSSNKSRPENKGKYSAQLPMQFAGKTLEGDPYGQINPIEVGTIVLVGYIEGDSKTPIVLAVIGNLDDNRELSRTTLSGSDPNDEGIKEVTQQKFDLYPSLTYRNIDGKGNRIVTFNGKSFMAMDSNSDLGKLSDDGFGDEYEDFESSYYYSGKLIEPKESKAPAILLKHTGDIDNGKETVPSSHSTMLFIDNDGTYRTSVLDEEEDWRSLIEIDSDSGRIRLRRNNDTLGLTGSQNFTGLDITENDIIFYLNGKVVNVSSLGGSTGGASGSTAGSDQIPRKELESIIDRINGNILAMGTYVEQTEEMIRAGAGLIEQTESDMAKYISDISLMADQIQSSVSETRIKNLVDEGIAGYSDELQKLVENSGELMDIIRDISNEGIITPSEKTQLYIQWDMIKAEYPGYKYQAEQAELDTYSYDNAYLSLKDYLENTVFLDMNQVTNIESNDLTTYFRNYFIQRNSLVNSIYQHLNSRINDSVERTIEVGKIANQAVEDAFSADSKAKRSLRQLENIASDNIVTAQEKSGLRREYNNILGEWESYVGQAEQYEVDFSFYIEAKDELQRYVEDIGLFTDMQSDTTVNSTVFLDKFANYYDERNKLLSAITKKTRDMLRQTTANFEHYETQIKETAREIQLLAESVVAQGREIALNSASLSVQADSITKRITRTELNRNLDESRNNLNLAGQNLFVLETAIQGELNENTGVVEPNSEYTTSNFIRVEPRKLYTTSIFDNPNTGVVKVAFYDSARQFIEGKAFSTTEEYDKFLQTPPTNSAYARISFNDTEDRKIQFESGHGTGHYIQSNADMVASVESATEELESRAVALEKAKQDYDTYRNNRIENVSLVQSVVENNVLSEHNLNQLNNMVDRLEQDKQNVIATAQSNGVNTTLYGGRLESLVSYIRNLQAGDTLITSNLMNLLDRYYQAKEPIYSVGVSNQEKAYEAMEDVLNEVTETVLQADKLHRELVEKSDTIANSIAGILYEITESSNKESEVLQLIDELLVDGTLTPSDKERITPHFHDIQEDYKWVYQIGLGKGVGLQDLENAYVSLDSYYSEFITPENWLESNQISYQTFRSLFENYFRAKQVVLESVLQENRKEQTQVDRQINIAYKELQRKERELQEVRNALTDSELAIIRLEEKIDEISSGNYTVRILSTNGLTFRNRVINTKLQASLIKGSEDITDTIPAENFEWTKVNEYGEEDIHWNEKHIGIGREVHLTHGDVDNKATFTVEIFEDVMEEIDNG